MHVEGGGGVFPNDNEIFALLRKARKIGLRKLFSPARSFRSEFIDSCDGGECTIYPDAGLGELTEIRCDTIEFFDTAVGVDDGELRACGDIGDVCVFGVLGAESGLVYADGTPVVDVQGIEVAAIACFASAVDFGKACC